MQEPTTEFYSYVHKHAALGAALGTAASIGLSVALHKKVPSYKSISPSFKTFIIFAGGGVGFTIASDKAIIRFNRTLDRPHLTQTPSDPQVPALPTSAYEYTLAVAKQNKFKAIFGAWAVTLGSVLYASWSDPILNSAARIGHARLAAQGVTLIAVLLAFGMDAENGISGERYKPGYSREL